MGWLGQLLYLIIMIIIPAFSNSIVSNCRNNYNRDSFWNKGSNVLKEILHHEGKSIKVVIEILENWHSVEFENVFW